MIADAHCHFFSGGFFRALAGDMPDAPKDPAIALPARLGWDPPGDDAALADRWVAELEKHGVGAAMLIASVPGDEASVAAAVARHPSRFAGAFMLNPTAADAEPRLERAFIEHGMRTVCLFPAMHRYSLDDARVDAVFALADRLHRVVFVHCGLLTLGVRKKLGLRSPFDIRLGDPLAVAAVAARHPGATVIIPHFGAGFFHEALMAADAAPNIVFDSSSSNGWIKFHPGLTLHDALGRALDCVGPGRILFGTDSSFFPRGWQRSIFDAQQRILEDLGVGDEARDQIFGDNLVRLMGLGA